MQSANTKWIWLNSNPSPEEYGCFKTEFNTDAGKKVTLKLAAETDYVAYINGTVVGFSQYPAYPFLKYYEEIDITPFCNAGENEFIVTVRYEGMVSSTHVDDGAGVIYEITSGDDVIAQSCAGTLCGYDGRYVQHEVRNITIQLGNTSGMKAGCPVFDREAVEIDKTYNIKKRPIKKPQYVAFEEAKPIGNNIYDLGRETAGYLYIKMKSHKPDKVKVGYGEHIVDGNVRHFIDGRDFSLDFYTEEGENEFTQYFIRIAGRYLEIVGGENTEIISMGVHHYLYPLTEKKADIADEDKEIYKTCIRTLRLCMNHHYEDCPWREQAMYVLDSRNQMLCGYYAFEELEFQRQCLLLMSKGIREDGFFEMTFPARKERTIPFFSVMYPVLVAEYIAHTGDKSVLCEVMTPVKNVTDKFLSLMTDKNLIPEFKKPIWNFYEWTDGSDGTDEITGEAYHLILNCAFVYAGESYKSLCEMAGEKCDIDFESIKKAIVKEFYNEETGLFRIASGVEKYSQLGNAFACLIGLGDERTVEAVKTDESLIPATLSMIGYVYDALLKADYDSNKSFVLEDIRKKYNYMLNCGATSFWETILGEADFCGAGSLCHGWSAMPVYYFNILKD